MTEAPTIYDRAFALADVAWGHGFRYDAADLALSMSKGSTSGEILPELFHELKRQSKKPWVAELNQGSEVAAILEMIRGAAGGSHAAALLL